MWPRTFNLYLCASPGGSIFLHGASSGAKKIIIIIIIMKCMTCSSVRSLVLLQSVTFKFLSWTRSFLFFILGFFCYLCHHNSITSHLVMVGGHHLSFHELGGGRNRWTFVLFLDERLMSSFIPLNIQSDYLLYILESSVLGRRRGLVSDQSV